MKKVLSLCICMFLIASALAGCAKSAAPSAEADAQDHASTQAAETLTVALTQQPSTLLPAQAQDTAQSYVYHLFEGLYGYDESGQIVNALAEVERADESGRIWTFTLRDDARWSDGESVRAQDFVYAWRRAVAPDTQSVYASLYLPIQNASAIMEGWADPSSLGAVALSDTQLQVTFEKPVQRVSTLFVHQAFYPLREDLAQSYETMQQEDADFCALVTNGPYVISEFESDHMLLQKSDTYRDAPSILNDTLRFLFLDDDAQYDAFWKQEIAFADDVSDDVLTATYGVDHSGIVRQPVFGVTYAAFNNHAAPFDQAQVRRAFSLCVRQQSVSESLLGRGLPATCLVPTCFSHTDPVGSPLSVSDAAYAENLLLAKQLLSDAGFADAQDFPTVYLIYQQTSSAQTALAKTLCQFWLDQLDIHVTPVPLDESTYQSRLAAGDYGIAIVNFSAEVDDKGALLKTFVTGMSSNAAQYASMQYDALIQSAQSAADTAGSDAQYHAAETLLLEDAAIVPVLFHADISLQSDNVSGIVQLPSGVKLFSYASLKSPA
jgi:oligopeptide transport system substrate-binding protein